MSRKRTKLEAAAGKLISAIQKVWTKELGEPEAELSEEVMNRAHDLLKAAKEEQVEALLSGNSVSTFLGGAWVEKHSSIKPSIASFESILGTRDNV
jgi:hypothetical protein